MSRTQAPGLIFQNENVKFHNEGPAVKKTGNTISKTSQTKGGGNRKALQDLSNSVVPKTQSLAIHKEGSVPKELSDGVSTTFKKKGGVNNRKPLQNLSNSLSIHRDVAGKKKNLAGDDINVFDERFLHNSKQCREISKAEIDQNTYHEVLLEHGLLDPDTSSPLRESEASTASPPKNLELEPIPELLISTNSDSPLSSSRLYSLPPSASFEELPELKTSVPKAQAAEITLHSQIFVHDKGLSVKKMNGTMPRDAEKKVEQRALGSRKALQDITNTSSLGQRAATKKNLNVGNVVEEGFLHDHSKCTAAQKFQMDRDLYNALLSEHGLLNLEASPEKNDMVAVTCDSPPRYLDLEEIPELPMSAMIDLCPSPDLLDSPLFSPPWYMLPELVLKSCSVE